jgi:hypothetical protein
MMAQHLADDGVAWRPMGVGARGWPQAPVGGADNRACAGPYGHV